MNKFTKFIAGTALAAASFTVSAGEVKSGASAALASWSTEASAALDKSMVYTNFAVKFNDEGVVTYKVTIDGEGNVTDVKLLSNTGRGYIKQSALKSIKRTDFPELPATYEMDSMTFKVQLSYLINPTQKDIKKLERQLGKVQSERLAGITLTSSYGR